MDESVWVGTAELVRPTADGLVRNVDTSFGEQILDVAQAEFKPIIQPDRILDNLGREAVADAADLAQAVRITAGDPSISAST